MSILWDKSLLPWLDPSGNPYSGLKAYFFDAGTTTPMVTYNAANLAIPNDHPVVANSAGAFPPIFLPEATTFRVRILTAAGSTIWDVDFVSAPTTIVPDPPSGGTATEFLLQTGHIITAWRSSVPTGFVRLNGRTIGGPSSAATERANIDCQALFIHLWTEDANLAVSGGRGASAAGDWAAAKTIALPDWRDRTPVGLGGMGNTKSTLIADSQTNGDTDALGTLGGEGKHALTIPELAPHTHTGNTNSDGLHVHAIIVPNALISAGGQGAGKFSVGSEDQEGTIPSFNTETTGSAHVHAFTTDLSGSGTAHNIVQPSVFVPYFIKL
jgi:microcystin-dependent protein